MSIGCSGVHLKKILASPSKSRNSSRTAKSNYFGRGFLQLHGLGLDERLGYRSDARHAKWCVPCAGRLSSFIQDPSSQRALKGARQENQNSTKSYCMRCFGLDGLTATARKTGKDIYQFKEKMLSNCVTCCGKTCAVRLFSWWLRKY